MVQNCGRTKVEELSNTYNLNVNVSSWTDYLKQITPVQSGKIEMFA
jgi:hypothetical protein